MRGILHFFWFLAIAGAIVGYSLYLDNAGLVTTGRVSAKHEIIAVHAGNWNRHLELQARFQVPGEVVPRYAQGSVDTATYDRTRIGDSLAVRYLPSPVLHQIVLIPTARLASDTTFSFPGDWGPIERGAIALVFFAALLMIAVKTSSRIAWGLFIVLGALAFGYFLFPREMPAPAGNTQSARATVAHVSTVTRILEGRRSRGMTVSQPYDIVQLSFVPQGRTEPVIAVDEVDHDSIPELAAGDVLPIQYQVDEPRIARILAGSRTFPEKARLTYVVNTGCMLLFLWLVYWVHNWLRAKATRALGRVQAAAMQARSRDVTRKSPGGR